jgi:hypothetical protein
MLVLHSLLGKKARTAAPTARTNKGLVTIAKTEEEAQQKQVSLLETSTRRRVAMRKTAGCSAKRIVGIIHVTSIDGSRSRHRFDHGRPGPHEPPCSNINTRVS